MTAMWISVMAIVAFAFRLSAQAVRIVTLKPKDATLREEFSNLSVNAIRELRDGRVLVVETGEVSRLVLADFTTGAVTPIGRRGRGPGEYERGAGLYALAGDSTLMAAGGMRWLLLDGARIVHTTTPDDRAIMATRGLLYGVDHQGFVLGTAAARSSPDSSTKVLISRRTGAATPVANLASAAEPGYPPPPRQVGNM